MLTNKTLDKGQYANNGTFHITCTVGHNAESNMNKYLNNSRLHTLHIMAQKTVGLAKLVISMSHHSDTCTLDVNLTLVYF